ncbi:hypothetical protein [Castellaniella sp. MT123]|uniref:hypothetical protein n=1 Tax=Castellaniella sp. MT123 TaxID=3140381 RepID=UPI0031F45E70
MSKQLEQVRLFANRIEEQREGVMSMLAGVSALLGSGDTFNAVNLLVQAMDYLGDTASLQALRKAAGGGND